MVEKCTVHDWLQTFHNGDENLGDGKECKLSAAFVDNKLRAIVDVQP